MEVINVRPGTTVGWFCDQLDKGNINTISHIKEKENKCSEIEGEDYSLQKSFSYTFQEKN